MKQLDVCMGGTEMIYIVIVVTFILVLCGLYLISLARRIDRLQSTVMKSRRSLENALTARAQYAHDFAHMDVLDMAGSVLLSDSADLCLRLGMLPIVDDGLDSLDPLHVEHEERIEHLDNNRLCAEEHLSETLRLTLNSLHDIDQEATQYIMNDEQRYVFEQLERARLDVRLTRSFHNSHVEQIQNLRNEFFVRTFHLAGFSSLPITVDFDDE
ncbi:MAG: hypothetical protein J6M18_04470 [Actinomycetaceae bacterium]|nr:hypothetical protein [Actinomycetaceae bacterium]